MARFVYTTSRPVSSRWPWRAEQVASQATQIASSAPSMWARSPIWLSRAAGTRTSRFGTCAVDSASGPSLDPWSLVTPLMCTMASSWLDSTHLRTSFNCGTSALESWPKTSHSTRNYPRHLQCSSTPLSSRRAPTIWSWLEARAPTRSKSSMEINSLSHATEFTICPALASLQTSATVVRCSPSEVVMASFASLMSLKSAEQILKDLGYHSLQLTRVEERMSPTIVGIDTLSKESRLQRHLFIISH